MYILYPNKKLVTHQSSLSKARTKGFSTPASSMMLMGGFCSRDSIRRAALAAVVMVSTSLDFRPRTATLTTLKKLAWNTLDKKLKVLIVKS